MRKLEKYTSTKTYMYPNGSIATPERLLADFPAVGTFAHVIETDEAGEVCFSVENLSALRSFHNIDTALGEAAAIAAIEAIINAPPPEPEPEDNPLADALNKLSDVLEEQSDRNDFIDGLMEGLGV